MSRILLRPDPFYILLFSVTSCCGFFSCESPTEKIPVAGKKTILKAPTYKLDETVSYLNTLFQQASGTELVIDGDTIKNSAEIKNAYTSHSFQPFWLNGEGVNANVSDYLQVLKEIRYDGMNPELYQLGRLENKLSKLKNTRADQNELNAFELQLTHSFLTLSKDMLLGNDTIHLHAKDWKNKNDSIPDFGSILCKTIDNNDVKAAVDIMRPQHNYYKAFRKEYQRLDSIRQQGGWNKVSFTTDSSAFENSANEIQALRKRLFNEMNVPLDTSSATWTEDLTQSILKFQYCNYIKPSGKIDTTTLRKLNIGVETKMKALALNMERMRWMKHDFPQPYIWVDVPKMELNYVEKDTVQFNMRVVVGRPGRPTTMLDAKLENIVFSPPWIVPPTIMKEEVVPGIARRGGSYLSRRGLKAYDRRGRIVSASAINAKNYRSFSIGQAPGYRSSLGEVKFNLPNPWSIYLHDTPHREDFVKFYRAYSSGCIRVHHPKEFAAFLLRDTVQYSFSKIDSICKKRKTIFVPIKRTVNVHIVYLTNALDSSGHVMYLKDIYNWDKG